jgi:hypothetical protein
MTSALTHRRGRGKALASMTIIAAALRIADEIRPCSVRALCYRLFTEKLIENMSKGCTDKVSKLLVWAREQGELPWGWIVDETREAERIASWDNPEDIISAAVSQYRKDYWALQPNRVEVWSEKGTVRGTLAPVLKKYGVTFRVMHGYGSATSIYSVAQETADNNKPLTVLYVGDWDPSGLQMSEIDLPARLHRYGGTATIRRVALDAKDTADNTDLPYFEAVTKSKDPRHQWFVRNYGQRCWEVDALSPVILRERIEAEIMVLLNMSMWDHALMVERAERESMQNVLGNWKASISGQASKYSPEAPS